ELQILDFAVIQILVIIFIELVRYTKKSQKKIYKSTRIWQRLGNVTMTVYIFESVLCILNMKWYVPLWEKLPQTSLILHLEVFIFVGMQFALWYGIIFCFGKRKITSSQ
ncbi:MAG: DUF418 domain-containing protein, partial [Promethearchaeota archaeon]